MVDSDTHVIEQKYGTEWRVLAYLGPDRESTFVIDFSELHGGGSIRVRKLMTPDADATFMMDL